MSKLPETLSFPGVIDIHAHPRALSITNAENYESASRAAALGGVVAIGDMPNDPGHPVKTARDVFLKEALVLKDSLVPVIIIAGSQPDWNNEGQLQQMMDYCGAAKFYAGTTTGNKHDHPYEGFADAVQVIHKETPDKPIMVHLGEDNTQEFIHKIAGEVGHPLHVCHVRPKDMSFIIEAKKKGWPVTCGICPHHLLMTSKDAETRGWFAQMQPELFKQEDVEWMWQLLRDGTIDIIESDHAPHSKEAKWAAEHENPHGEREHECTCFGVTSLELMMPLLFRQAMLENISLERLAEATSTLPAQIIGINPRSIPEVSWRMKNFRIEDESKRVISQAGHTPYLGMLGIGEVEFMPIGDQTIVNNGKIVSRHPKVLHKRGESL